VLSCRLAELVQSEEQDLVRVQEYKEFQEFQLKEISRDKK
jgi:hypothetical protein